MLFTPSFIIPSSSERASRFLDHERLNLRSSNFWTCCHWQFTSIWYIGAKLLCKILERFLSVSILWFLYKRSHIDWTSIEIMFDNICHQLLEWDLWISSLLFVFDRAMDGVRVGNYVLWCNGTEEVTFNWNLVWDKMWDLERYNCHAKLYYGLYKFFRQQRRTMLLDFWSGIGTKLYTLLWYRPKANQKQNKTTINKNSSVVGLSRLLKSATV